MLDIGQFFANEPGWDSCAPDFRSDGAMSDIEIR